MITDRLPWRDRLKALAIALLLLAALYWLTACGGELPDEPPDTQPAAARYTLLIPFARWDYSYSGGKAGVSIIGNNKAAWAQPERDDATRVGAGWYYNWHYIPDFGGVAQDKAEFVPMIWGKAIPADLPCPPPGAPLMWLNEPNLYSQANATPEQAAAMLMALVERCPEARLVGPHMSSDRSAFTWLASFWSLWAATGRPFPSTLGVHVYNHPRPSEWIDAIYGAVPGYAGRVWVTEFAYCGDGDRLTTFAGMVAALEADDRVERYAPFANRIDPHTQDFAWLACGSLLDERGQLTGMGRVYRGDSATRGYP